jgi:hypothetical protein
VVHTFYHIGIVLVLFACLGRTGVAQASEPVADPWPIEIVPQHAALAPLDKNRQATANAAVNHSRVAGPNRSSPTTPILPGGYDISSPSPRPERWW